MLDCWPLMLLLLLPCVTNFLHKPESCVRSTDRGCGFRLPIDFLYRLAIGTLFGRDVNSCICISKDRLLVDVNQEGMNVLVDVKYSAS